MTVQDTAARYAPYVLSIVRIVAALLFFEHGTSRLFGWPSPLPTPALLSMYGSPARSSSSAARCWRSVFSPGRWR